MSDKEFAVPALPQKKQQQQVSEPEAAPEAAPEAPKPLAPSDNKPQAPKLNYEKPVWSTKPQYKYSFEVLKNGQSIETIQGPEKEFITLGRLPLCDILLEHPSISRYHAVIQFNEDGDAYIYDLDSAHGTRVNKKTINGREYTALKPGDQVRFGESTRICIFDSEKPYDPEAEMETKRQLALRKKIADAKGEIVPKDDREQEEGISWGFAEDAVEEDDGDDDGTEYNQEDIESGLNNSGDAGLLNIEATKMAIEDAKRRREDLEIMYGDDSDEELYDKTSKKKKKVEKAATHDELVVQQKQAEEKIKKLTNEIEERKRIEKETKEDEEDLDAYMNNLSKKPLDNRKSLFTLQKELNQLKKDNDRLIKLVKLTKPSHIL